MTVRTGVILGMKPSTTKAEVDSMLDTLTDMFPNITFCLVPGATNSIAFPYEDGVYPEAGTGQE